MNNSRTKSAKLNSITASVSQFLSLGMQFISRTIFIYTLGGAYLGLNGLLTNILNILSFSELGIGAAFTFLLYKPLVINDEHQISALMRIYRKTYRFISVIILILGLLLMPILPYFIHGDTKNVGNIYIAFFLFLMNTVVSYLWNYKRSILLADQSGYLNSLNSFIFQFFAQMLQIIFLLNWPNYYIYLAIQIFFTIASNLQISRLVDKKYPYLRSKEVNLVNSESLEYLKKNILGMMSSKLGGVIIFSTDNLLLSSFVGLVAVGKYSNYTLILAGITSIVGQGVGAVTASIGNLNITADKYKKINIFYKYTYISGIIGLFISIGLITYLDTFISVWIGTQYILSPLLTWLIVINFFITQLRQANINFTNAYGLYWEQRFKPIFEAIVNLIIAIVLLKLTHLGIASVIIATICSNLFVNSWWEPLILFKYGLDGEIKQYTRFYVVQLASGILVITVAQFIAQAFSVTNQIIYSTLLTLAIIFLGVFLFEFVNIFFGYPKKMGRITFLGQLVRIFKAISKSLNL